MILCNIGEQAGLRVMGTAMGTSRRGGGGGRSVARATVAEPNLSGFARSESQQSGDGCHHGDVCLVWPGQAGRREPVVEAWREREGHSQQPHQGGPQVRAWTPHLMCFDNGDRMRKGWKGWADGGQVAR